MKYDSKPFWHTLDPASALARLGVSPKQGLSTQAASERLKEEGLNELVERGAKSPLRIFAEQFTSLMVLLLIAAAAVSGILLREWADALVILVIVILNALLGFWQEFRAEKALAALKSLSAPRARVLRDSEAKEIASRELVRGDIVLIGAGNLIPADCRILESANLRCRRPP